MRRKRPIRVVFAVYDGVSLLNLAGPLNAFTIASEISATRGDSTYQCTVVSTRGGLVRTSEGVSIQTKRTSALRNQPIDMLIVPGAADVDDITRDRALIDWIRKRGSTCRRVVAECTGSYLLAEAGLLHGARVTTHWAYATHFARRFPTVEVEADPIYIRDGRTWSSAGLTAGIDLALALIQEDLGREAALNVARFMVVYLRRSGGQSQYSAVLSAQTDDDPDGFADLEQWILEHLAEDLTVETLAQRVNMSPRNFARVYANRRGRTPAKSVEAIRVDAARRLLDESAEQIEIVARRCGFTSEEQMRCAFQRTIGIPPRDYRRRFSGQSPQEQSNPETRTRAAG